MPEPDDDGQDFDGRESGSARAVPESGNDGAGCAHAARFEVARIETQIHFEARDGESAAARSRLAQESRLWRADPFLVARAAATDGGSILVSRNDQTPFPVPPARPPPPHPRHPLVPSSPTAQTAPTSSSCPLSCARSFAFFLWPS